MEVPHDGPFGSAGLLPAVMAAWFVLLKSTLSKVCRSSSADPPQSSVKASPCHRALELTLLSALKVILSAAVPTAVNLAHVPSACSPPSKDIPVSSAMITSTPGSMVKSAVTDK